MHRYAITSQLSTEVEARVPGVYPDLINEEVRSSRSPTARLITMGGDVGK